MYFREPACEEDNFPYAVETSSLLCLRALYADFPLRATGSLLALIDFTRSADDAPSSDNPKPTSRTIRSFNG